VSDILTIEAVLQGLDTLGHRRILEIQGNLLEVTGNRRWLWGDIEKLLKNCRWLLGSYWEVSGGDCSPSSHLCLSMDQGIKEAVLTLKDGLRGASQYVNLQTTGQGPAQRDSLSCWLGGLLQALKHLETEGRTPQFAAALGLGPWPLMLVFPGGQWNVDRLGPLSAVRTVGYSGAEARAPGF